MPAWKWAALVEAWLYAHWDPEKLDTLEAKLDEPIHFTWAKTSREQRANRLHDRIAWQTNTRGEVLLKGRSKKRVEGE